MKHLGQWPVSASTYQHPGCRCNGCRQAATDKQREHRRRNGVEPSVKIYSRADRRAARWVREWHPDVWAAIVADEYQQAQGKQVAR